MSVFKLPKTLLQSVNSVINNFWWGQREREHKIHWISWKNMGKAKSKGGMGFRDLECFNMAMLSKQCWRILQEPDSLAAKVLKAKYFQNSSFMSAKLGSKPSFLWRSFMAARQVVKAGTCWRIGNGKEVQIWQERWLGHPVPKKVTSPVALLDNKAMVSELIDQSSAQWKETLVREVFEEREADLILQTPLSSMNARDRVSWQGTKDGRFSVRSAYHMEKAREQEEKGQASCSNSLRQVWKQLWKLRVQPSDKVFMWRACLEALPTRTNLQKKREEETVVHAVWSCVSARGVWSLASKKLQKRGMSPALFVDLFESLLQVLDEVSIQEFVVVARRVWWRRNCFIFNNDFKHPKSVIREAHTTLALLHGENNNITTNPSPTCLSPAVWTHPPPHWYKINWDSSVNK
ncbi:hypothetical protein CIPAW_10G106100 [Carya illinoinensis]|uniref:Reverse transcriptase zinc-binding domain-containing protein n=1 Tax=Carya illinoinensis TaxID=32201 RepID=A0A8T1PCT5_CARIL|nr:hypothetical protein CIPAW_10G106100 [Carya illinoinensis]